MELLTIAEGLRRRRILLALGLLAAVVLGGLVSGVLGSNAARARQPAGAALAQVVIDTRPSLVATTTPGAQRTIVQRSVLLAALMQTDSITASIARGAHVAPSALEVLGPTLPPVTEFSRFPDGQLPVLAATAGQGLRAPDVVRLQPNYTVPIISIGTAAPTVGEAVALARATVVALRSAARYRTREPAGTAASAGPQSAIDAEPLGGVTSTAQPVSSIHILSGVAAAVALLVLWCAGVVIATGLGRLWRRAQQPATLVSI